MEDFLQRVLMFAVGSIMVGGGLTFALQSLEGQRSAFHAIVFGLAAATVGLYLCIWTFTGPPG